MYKKEIKTNKGITLIALVVTIIVLMIISGITVATLMGDNGIIKRAGDAKETQRGAAVQDEVTLAIAENGMIDQLNSVNGGNEAKKGKTEVIADLVGKGYLHGDEATLLQTEDTITIGSITIDFSKLTTESNETTITFYINFKGNKLTYEAKEGMNWNQWITEYSPAGFSDDGNGNCVYNPDGNYGYLVIPPGASTPPPVHMDEGIIEDAEYNVWYLG